MRAKVPVPPLDPALRRLLLEGPPVPYDMHVLPTHDALVQLWRQHEAALRPVLPRGRRAWIEERIYFVNAIRAGRR
jgi:hypothetical protein